MVQYFLARTVPCFPNRKSMVQCLMRVPRHVFKNYSPIEKNSSVPIIAFHLITAPAHSLHHFAFFFFSFSLFLTFIVPLHRAIVPSLRRAASSCRFISIGAGLPPKFHRTSPPGVFRPWSRQGFFFLW